MAGIRRKNDDVLALALASGDSVVDAAAKAKMGERTAYRRLDDPAFCRRVERLRGEMFKDAYGRLSAGLPSAVDVLCGLLKSNSETVRLSAARTMLDTYLKARGAVEMEERMREVETSIEQWRCSGEKSKPA